MPEQEQHCFEKEWINACPAGLLIMDSKGTIRWLNPALEELLGLEAAQLLGFNRASLRLTAYGSLFDDESVISVPGGTGPRWLHRESAPVSTAEDRDSILQIFRDVSELVQLRAEREQLLKQVDELTLTDELTGLANRRALSNALAAQVTRSRRYHNPLTLISVRVTLGASKTYSVPELPERAVLAVSHYMRDRLRWADIIGRYDPTLFMLILPETDRRAATVLIDKIRAESADMQLPNDLADLPLELGFGLAEWEQGDDPQSLTQRALAGEYGADGSMRATANSH